MFLHINLTAYQAWRQRKYFIVSFGYGGACDKLKSYIIVVKYTVARSLIEEYLLSMLPVRSLLAFEKTASYNYDCYYCRLKLLFSITIMRADVFYRNLSW